MGDGDGVGNVVSATNEKSLISLCIPCYFNDFRFPPATPPFPLETLSFSLTLDLDIERPGDKGRVMVGAEVWLW